MKALEVGKSKRRFFLLLLVAFTLPTLFLTSRMQSDQSESLLGKLAGSRDSAEAVAEAFLEALAEMDEDSIRQLAVSRQEWDKYVWPELPVSNPRANYPADFVWNQMAMRSESGLRMVLSRYGGRDLDLVSLRFTEGIKEYENFQIHRDARLIVEDETGIEKELNLFGSVMEMDEEFKIFSFVLD